MSQSYLFCLYNNVPLQIGKCTPKGSGVASIQGAL